MCNDCLRESRDTSRALALHTFIQQPVLKQIWALNSRTNMLLAQLNDEQEDESSAEIANINMNNNEPASSSTAAVDNPTVTNASQE